MKICKAVNRMFTAYHKVALRAAIRRTVAVPGVRLADGAAALHTDRGHSLRSLLPPPAALPSLPTSFATLSRQSDGLLTSVP